MTTLDLTDEELEEVFIMDWRPQEVAKSGIDRSEAQRLVAESLRPINDKLTSIASDLTQVRIQIREKPETAWEAARRKIIFFGAPVAIVSVCLTLLSITLAAVYVATTHVREETAFRAY